MIKLSKMALLLALVCLAAVNVFGGGEDEAGAGSSVNAVSGDAEADSDADTDEYDESITSHSQAIRLAVARINLGDNEGAIAMAMQTLKMNPCDDCAAKAYEILGRAYMGTGDFAKSIENYDKQTGLEPRNANAYNTLACLSYWIGDYERALAYVNTAIRLDARQPHFFATRAEIALFSGGDLASAADDLRAADRLSDQGILDLLKRVTIDDFDHIISVDSTHSNAYAYRGVVHILLEDFDAAAADFESAKRFEPNNPVVRRFADNVAQRRNILALGRREDDAKGREKFNRAVGGARR